MYTLCHRRSGASYTVMPCKPDSSWSKYKHQGSPRRQVVAARYHQGINESLKQAGAEKKAAEPVG